jgi:hypothetical protein
MVTYQLAAELWHPLQVWSRSWNQIAQLHKVSETACPNIVRSFLSLHLKPFILYCGQNNRKHQTQIGRLNLTNTYNPTDLHHRNMGANKLYFQVHTRSTFCSLILLHTYDTCKCFAKLLEMLTACLLLCLTLPEGPTHLQCTICCHRYITILAGMTVQRVRKESRHKKKPTSMSCRQFPQRLKLKNRLKLSPGQPSQATRHFAFQIACLNKDMTDYELLVVNSSIPPTKSLQANMLIMQKHISDTFSNTCSSKWEGE